MTTEQQAIVLAAISSFGTWSNVLLVATTGALAWLPTAKGALHPYLHRMCLVLFGLSVIFGIFTLGLIPLVTEYYVAYAEQTDSVDSASGLPASFYVVTPSFELLGKTIDWIHLKCACFPQHVFFLVGIIVYALGLKWKEDESKETAQLFVYPPETVTQALQQLNTNVTATATKAVDDRMQQILAQRPLWARKLLGFPLSADTATRPVSAQQPLGNKEFCLLVFAVLVIGGVFVWEYIVCFT